MWATIKTITAEADNCNTNKQPCTMGKLASTTIVAVKPEEAETHRKLVEGAVLANWEARCQAVAREWNDTVGKALGLKAPERSNILGSRSLAARAGADSLTAVSKVGIDCSASRASRRGDLPSRSAIVPEVHCC